jgi:hypothetical protein
MGVIVVNLLTLIIELILAQIGMLLALEGAHPG